LNARCKRHPPVTTPRLLCKYPPLPKPVLECYYPLHIFLTKLTCFANHGHVIQAKRAPVL
jgi:hypothetical protein